MEWLLKWVLFFPATCVSAVLIQDSPVTCQSYNTECNPYGDNSIGNFAGIEPLQVD